MSASMETMLELWVSSLRDVKARIRPLFTQARVAASVGLFLDGLLGPERRKTGWMRAEAAGGAAQGSACAASGIAVEGIPVLGANKRSSAAAGGRRMCCATWCVIMRWRRWPT